MSKQKCKEKKLLSFILLLMSMIIIVLLPAYTHKPLSHEEAHEKERGRVTLAVMVQ